jgi:hypothetical protein
MDMVCAANVQNIANIAIFTAFVAQFPPNCPAGSTGKAAELTFCVGGRLG